MHTAHLTATVFGTPANGAAAATSPVGHEYPKSQLDMKGITPTWAPPLGVLPAAGALGLAAGPAVPVLGTVAAAGLVLYFVGAIAAHPRVGSRNVVGGIVLLATAATVLTLGLLDRGAW
jgi:hypothetical protein